MGYNFIAHYYDHTAFLTIFDTFVSNWAIHFKNETEASPSEDKQEEMKHNMHTLLAILSHPLSPAHLQEIFSTDRVH